MPELSKSVTFHDFCELRNRLNRHQEPVDECSEEEEEEEEEEEDVATTSSAQQSPAPSDNSSTNTTTTTSNDKQKKTNRRGLPLNTSFSSWLQLFLSKKRRNGTFSERCGGGAQLASIRPSVSLCKRE
jgi:hypothetical protein